ncbi:MAG TPA: CHASE2 domain-containing protein [Bryobacteraceae bacterium]|nr:CHASE2 domain-containing protein [Bryobacteraceae bacterium]
MRKSARQAAATLAIVVAAAALGIFAAWRAPGIERYARDWLMRARGPLPPPGDIALVAIDDASIARFGRFPWPRSLMARAIDTLAAAQPKVIALDVLYTDPTNAADDAALAQAIARAGNVVVAAQLTEGEQGQARWLLPLPDIQRAAAGVGHVNVFTESEGVAGELPLRAADDEGRALPAMAVEAVRVADGTVPQAVVDTPSGMLLGARRIPAQFPAPTLVIAPQAGSARVPNRLRAGRMAIDYIGPAGSFAPHTYGIADLLDGRAPAAALRGRYVLVGATASSLGDRVASPFLHTEDWRGSQHGTLMPGVEVLANAINTILQARFYTETPDWLAFLIAMLVAAATLGLLAVSQGRYELPGQAGALAVVAAGTLGLSYLAFRWFLVFPPLTAATVSFAAAGMMGLLRRTLAASASLDASIAQIGQAEELLAPIAESSPRPEPGDPRLAAPAPWWKLPRGVEWKAQALAWLNRRLLARARFIDRALRSVEDGLVVAGTDGRIAFANPRAAEILGAPGASLKGENLFERLAERAHLPDDFRGLPARLLADGRPLEREIAIRDSRTRHYTLRLSAVFPAEEPAAALGIVASLSDITRQRELQQTKNDVVALVSHEMRTPLTAIQGMSELMAQYEVDPERRREMNQAMNEEVKRLTRMIDEYLDIARLESGARTLTRSPVRVELLVERVVLLLEPLAARRSIRLAKKFGAGLPALLADADLLARAVNNLVANAIKYSPEHTEVTVSVEADAAELRVGVADQGYGIPPEHLERIFEKFHRVPRLEDADAPGTGLGLALVREIAELHGGRVTVESQAGKGSTFTLCLPRQNRPDSMRESQ